MAVVLSLIHAAVQLRGNARATRLTALQALTSDLGNARHAQAQTGDVFRLYEALHWHARSGTLDPEIWAGYRTANHDLLSHPGVRTVWDLRRSVYSVPFQQFVEEQAAVEGGGSVFGPAIPRP